MVAVGLTSIGVYAYTNDHHDETKPASAVATYKKKPASKSPVAATSPATPTYTAGAPCQSTQLSLAVAKDLHSVMNQPAAYYSFTNTSTALCTLTGYPTVKLYNPANALISPSIKNDGAYQLNDPGPAPATVAPGAKIYFGLGWGTLDPSPNQLEGGCTTIAALEAIAPGTTTVLRANTPLQTTICNRGVSVTAIAPAAAFTTTNPE